MKTEPQITHYIGDDCPGGHKDEGMPVSLAPGEVLKAPPVVSTDPAPLGDQLNSALSSLLSGLKMLDSRILANRKEHDDLMALRARTIEGLGEIEK